MPTYQYACTDCGHAFDQFQSFSDDALTVCPECSGRLRKLFNAVGVVFKGSGFYRNDSRGKSGASETPHREVGREVRREVGREVGREVDDRAGRLHHLVLRLLVRLVVEQPRPAAPPQRPPDLWTTPAGGAAPYAGS